MTIEFKLPDLGENVEQADVVNVLVAEGHVIQAGQNVLELETDKAVVELPVSQGGRVTKVHVKNGDKIRVGATLLTIEEDASAEAKPQAQAKPSEEAPAQVEEQASKLPPAERPDAPQVEETKVAPSAPETPRATGPRKAPVPAGPATRRMARELGVDLHQVSGTGPGGRIIEEDIKAYVRQVQSQALAGTLAAPQVPPMPDFAQWGPIERVPMGGIRRKTAENTSLAWRTAPHVTQFDTADVTELEAARKHYQESRGADAHGKVTMTVLAMKAAVAALKKFPQFNSSVDAPGGNLILKHYFHLGIAVDTENGLLVPVIHDVDRKSIAELATELEEAAEKARRRKLSAAEMQGGTFTITNLGGIGGTNFSPIVNYPEVAILGMSRAAQNAVVHNGAIEIRTLLPLSLSYDHRAIDGAAGARFLRYIVEVFSDPMKLLLEG